MATYSELRLRIDRGVARGSYRIVATGPAGEALGRFKLPFSDLELENFILRIGSTRRGKRRIDSPEMELAKTFGTKLFGALFEGDVRELYRSSFAETRSEGRGLRVTLSLTGAPELLQVPWEYMYDHPSFLSISTWTPIVRYLDLPKPRRPLQIELPLRILGLVSAPSDFDAIDAAEERAKLETALAPLIEMGAIAIDWLEEASLRALQRQLRKADYHVFHYIGHGGYDDAADDGVLLFEDEQGRGRRVSGVQLGTILADEVSLRLAVLNSCEGGRSSLQDPFSGVATSLIEREIPAVIGMQFEITDRAAIVFGGEFYAALADGLAVDSAVAEARKAIYADQNDIEWGTPVLFMRVADGKLFDVKAHAPVRPAPQPELRAELDDVADVAASAADVAEPDQAAVAVAAAAAEAAERERAAEAERVEAAEAAVERERAAEAERLEQERVESARLEEARVQREAEEAEAAAETERRRAAEAAAAAEAERLDRERAEQEAARAAAAAEADRIEAERGEAERIERERQQREAEERAERERSAAAALALRQAAEAAEAAEREQAAAIEVERAEQDRLQHEVEDAASAEELVAPASRPVPTDAQPLAAPTVKSDGRTVAAVVAVEPDPTAAHQAPVAATAANFIETGLVRAGARAVFGSLLGLAFIWIWVYVAHPELFDDHSFEETVGWFMFEAALTMIGIGAAVVVAEAVTPSIRVPDGSFYRSVGGNRVAAAAIQGAVAGVTVGFVVTVWLNLALRGDPRPFSFESLVLHGAFTALGFAIVEAGLTRLVPLQPVADASSGAPSGISRAGSRAALGGALTSIVSYPWYYLLHPDEYRDDKFEALLLRMIGEAVFIAIAVGFSVALTESRVPALRVPGGSAYRIVGGNRWAAAAIEGALAGATVLFVAMNLYNAILFDYVGGFTLEHLAELALFTAATFVIAEVVLDLRSTRRPDEVAPA